MEIEGPGGHGAGSSGNLGDPFGGAASQAHRHTENHLHDHREIHIHAQVQHGVTAEILRDQQLIVDDTRVRVQHETEVIADRRHREVAAQMSEQHAGEQHALATAMASRANANHAETIMEAERRHSISKSAVQEQMEMQLVQGQQACLAYKQEVASEAEAFAEHRDQVAKTELLEYRCHMQRQQEILQHQQEQTENRT